MQVTIDNLKKHVEAIKNGDCDVKPGTDENFTEACTVGDRICQGDVNFTIKEEQHLPYGYVKWEKIPSNKQLVHGSDPGSMHCLDSLEGVEAYVPGDWGPTSLVGPFLILSKDVTATHPKHGNVKMLANTCIHVTYQRELDKERRIMRALD